MWPNKAGVPCPKTWQEAFHLLQELLDRRYTGGKQVVFIDELPWMDSPRSTFLSAFEHFCNDWCLSRKHVKLIVCGSATSWIADEMLSSKGGLYDRVTSKIFVKPFTLKECKEYFISSYLPFGEREKKFKLADSFCYFYLHHVKDNIGNGRYWQNNSNSPSMNSWLGLAFEEVVFNHIAQVKQALGISGVVTKESSWSVEGGDETPGMQIDLIIDREDRVINICEIKFCRGDFVVNGKYARRIQDRISATEEFTKHKRTIVSVLITTYGIKHNEYSSRFQKIITMDDLFA